MTVDELFAVLGRGISPTVVGGTRPGSPVDLDLTRKTGQPDTREPIGRPVQPPPGTPPGRPIANPPPPPGDRPPPRQPRPTNPIRDPGQPPLPEEPLPDGKGGGPSPTPMPGGDDFAKGQVYPELMPGGYFSPTAGDFYGDGGFNAYRGANRGIAPPGRAGVYDPLGIGADSYGGGPYGGLPGSSQNVYGMTGVNAVTGYQGPARYGVVGGQGGYGVGMVGPEYSGPLFDDATGALKAMRRQRRLLNQSTRAVYDGSPVAAPTGAGTPQAAPGKTGQPATGTPTAPPAAGANQQQPGKTGQPATGAQQQQQGTPAQTGVPQSFYESGVYDTPWGTLVQDSGGQGNVFRRLGANGADDGMRFHYDPRAAGTDGAGQKAGWKSMTVDAMRGYGNYNYANPYEYAQQAGARRTDYQQKNGLWQAKVGTGTYA